MNGVSSILQTARVPWKDMVKSGPLWAIIIAHSFGNWGVYTLLTSLPEFMKSALKFDIKSVSVQPFSYIDLKLQICT